LSSRVGGSVVQGEQDHIVLDSHLGVTIAQAFSAYVQTLVSAQALTQGGKSGMRSGPASLLPADAADACDEASTMK
jgi:hypothetical protein